MDSLPATSNDKCITLDKAQLEQSVAPPPTPFNKRMEALVTRVGSSDPFPILDRIWDVYSGKGIRAVFVSIGASNSAIADLEIAESLGCPVNCVALSPQEEADWAEIATILKERKRLEGTNFSLGAELKWVLPKNLRVKSTLPWWSNGTVELSGNTVATQSIGEYVASVVADMKVKDNRIDLLKIDTLRSAPGLERGILGAVLNAGFRPALVLVRWTDMPDIHLSATLAAGHLQNSGYSLVGKVDNKFLYYYSQDDMYQICSWEGITGTNPMFHEIVSAARNPSVQK